MPRYVPNKVITDCWSSAGNVTFFHIDGECYWKSRACPEFPGTAAQRANADLHKRALEAWQNLNGDVQEQWNEMARPVVSHRPPFDGTGHITGHNLFVSAYHGFAQLGDEHIPDPVAYEEFPVMWMGLDSADEVEAGTLRMKLRTKLEGNVDPTRYRLHVRMQLTRPGMGRNGGKMRAFIAEANCTSSDCIVTVLVPDYKRIWDLDLSTYQVHCRYLLIDTRTGYRNIFKKKSFLMNIQ